MIPTAVLPIFMPTPELAYGLLILNTIGMAITAVLAITPGQIRGIMC